MPSADESNLPLSSDPARTAQRVVALDRYFQSAVLSGDRFCCASYSECRASHRATFYEGQLHHVGAHYDMVIGGNPLRIVVVGQEYGHGPARVDRSARSEMIRHFGLDRRFTRTRDNPSRNPHMRGTTTLLRLLFGRVAGSDYGSEFLSLDGRHVHIFEAFALTDFLLCSAIADGSSSQTAIAIENLRGGTRGRSSRVMRQNCAHHFRHALQILEPTIIVVQGYAVRRWMSAIFDYAEPAHRTLPLERIGVGSSHALLASFTHPSAPSRDNWGMNATQPYLLSVVVPTVAAALAAIVGDPLRTV